MVYRFLKATIERAAQNKVHFAIHGQTAAELIAARADSRLPNMGLTTWDGARIRKADVSIAKNYLNEEELRALNNLAGQYLMFAEGQAARRHVHAGLDHQAGRFFNAQRL